MSGELTTVSDLNVMAKAIAESGFGGCKTPAQALTLMLIAQSEGRHPGIIARDYHIINGRPCLKADAMLARFQEQGGVVRWVELTDVRAEAVFSHPRGGEVVIDWDIERAKRAGVYATNPNWQKYPRAQLRARVTSEGVRTTLPGVVCGTYTPEEADDMKDGPRQIDHEEVNAHPPAASTTAEATAAMTNARNSEVKPPKREANESDRPDFDNRIKMAGVRIGFESVIEVCVSHGYDDPAKVLPKDFRNILNAINEIENTQK